MTAEEARDLLIWFNQWRRDDHVPNKYEMPNPKQIGIAIDVAIEALSNDMNKAQISDESYANYSAQLSLPF